MAKIWDFWDQIGILTPKNTIFELKKYACVLPVTVDESINPKNR